MIKSAKLIIGKVPANDSEALKSSLMGLFEKKKCIDFYKFVENIEWDNKKTWKDFDLDTCPMEDVYKKYKLVINTIDFLGHAVALHASDDYLK